MKRIYKLIIGAGILQDSYTVQHTLYVEQKETGYIELTT